MAIISFILATLTLSTLTSVCIFSILFSIHSLRRWWGEFVSWPRASPVGDHFLYSHDLNMGIRGDIVRRIYMLVTLRSYRVKLPNKSRKPIMISNRTVSRLAIREMINMTFPFSHVFYFYSFCSVFLFFTGTTLLFPNKKQINICYGICEWWWGKCIQLTFYTLRSLWIFSTLCPGHFQWYC